MTSNIAYTYSGPSQATASDWSSPTDWSTSPANAPGFQGEIGADDTAFAANATFQFAGASLTNDGTLQGDGLALDDATLTQAGTIEATGAGGLVLADDTIAQIGEGAILANAAAGAATSLAISNSTVTGGTIEAAGPSSALGAVVSITASNLNSVDLFADGPGGVIDVSATTALPGVSLTMDDSGEISVSAPFNGAATFLGAGDTLSLAQPELSPASPDTLGPIAGFVEGDAIDLTALNFASVTAPPSYSTQAGGGTVVTVEGETRLGEAVSEQLTFVGASYAGGISLAADAQGGTLVETGVVCFCAGTLILTDHGEVEVERLSVGDLVVTSSGEPRPIRWIGHGAVEVRRHARPDLAAPVRIAAHALGPNRPARDLRVSPWHGLCLDVIGEVLVPAKELVNGATITREEVDRAEYWHIELDSHDLLIAENQPAESYLDRGNRAFFDGGEGEAGNALPDGDPDAGPFGGFCRPLHEKDALAQAVRARLRARALSLGWRLVEAAPWSGVYLEADGRIVHPVTRDLRARFALPEGATSVTLVSPACARADVSDDVDTRALGLALACLSIEDGFEPPRTIALDDPGLVEGFHACEGATRWTGARAALPAELWAGMKGPLTLCVKLSAPPLPRWAPPAEPAAPPLAPVEPAPPLLAAVA
jgi:hypothetical protein